MIYSYGNKWQNYIKLWFILGALEFLEIRFRSATQNEFF